MKPKRPSHPYWMLAPTVLVLGLFFVYPMLLALETSFARWDLLTDKTYVGLDNYRAIATQGDLVGILGRTLTFSVLVVLGSTSAGLALAVLLRRRGTLNAAVRGAVFSAYVVSWVSVALLWMWIFDGDSGLFTHLVKAIGLTPRNWLGDPRSALYVLAAVTIWKVTGFAMVIYLSGLEAIPESLYDAASLDGAGAWSKFIEITWPMLKPTTTFVLTTNFIMTFQAFDVVRIMTQGGPVDSTKLVVYAIYDEIFQNLRVGRASALIVVFFCILLGITWLNVRAFRAARRAPS